MGENERERTEGDGGITMERGKVRGGKAKIHPRSTHIQYPKHNLLSSWGVSFSVTSILLCTARKFAADCGVVVVHQKRSNKQRKKYDMRHTATEDDGYAPPLESGEGGERTSVTSEQT